MRKRICLYDSKMIEFRIALMSNDVSTYVTASYLVLVATIAAFVGQHVVRRVINILGRASIIIFILASTIFISAISLGEYCLALKK